jgi:hypothetical protein
VATWEEGEKCSGNLNPSYGPCLGERRTRRVATQHQKSYADVGRVSLHFQTLVVISLAVYSFGDSL